MNQNKMHNTDDNISINCGENDLHLSKQEYAAIQQECTQHEDTRAVSIFVLKIIQKKNGWISDDAVFAIAKMLRISVSDVEGVATFYNQIFRQPVGRHIIRYCDSVVCYIMGYMEIKRVLTDTLNIVSGGTTTDGRFTLLPTCCLGLCDKAPVIMIDEDFYVNLVPDQLVRLLGCYQ